MDFDFGHSQWGLDRGRVVFKAGKNKVPVTLARYSSAREFQFSDRSVASMYFDANRSLACTARAGYSRFHPDRVGNSTVQRTGDGGSRNGQ